MELKLAKIVNEAENIKTFVFDTNAKIKYYPGQNFYITINNLSQKDYRGPTRQFTLSSSPTEPQLKITTNIRDFSLYKQTLDNLKPGDVVFGEGPNGTFILDEHELGNHIFLAGGIGITPFRSFIKYNVDKKLTNTKLHMVYSCQTLDKAVFYKEMQSWSKKYNNISYDITITKPNETKQKWHGLTGRIDEKLLTKLIGNWKIEKGKYIFWICGPPAMVVAMEILLKKNKVKPSQIRTEKFTGY